MRNLFDILLWEGVPAVGCVAILVGVVLALSCLLHSC